jgi:hypothetical protein
MDKGIFISYRRDDSSGYTGRLSDDLNEILAGNRIFRYIETIEPGMDFVDSINKAVDSCAVLLVIIGPRWLTVTNAAGERRLDDPNDYNRLEIATALKRGIRVVPVLVGGAEMPEAGDLPEDLKALARRQAKELSDLRWKYDLDALLSVLEKIPGVDLTRAGEKPGPKPAPAKKPVNRKPLFIAGGAVAVLIAAIGIGSMMGGGDVADDGGGSGSPHNYVKGDVDIDQPAVDAGPAQPPSTRDVVSAPTSTENQASSDYDEPRYAAQQADPYEAQIEATTPMDYPSQQQAQFVDLNGTWQDVDGLIYDVAQAEEFVEIEVYEPVSGVLIGEGSGEIAGRMLSTVVGVEIIDEWGNYLADTYRAQLTLSSDGLTLQGTTTAQSTGLTTPVMLFRADDSGGY